MSSTFKVGDTVRAKEDVYNVLVQGKHYLIVATKPGFVDISDLNGLNVQKGWYASRFDLVAAAEAPRKCIVASKSGVPSPRPYVHSNRESATTEAKRLAEANPGNEFAVYERVSGFKADKPVAQEVAA